MIACLLLYRVYEMIKMDEGKEDGEREWLVLVGREVDEEM